MMTIEQKEREVREKEKQERDARENTETKKDRKEETASEKSSVDADEILMAYETMNEDEEDEEENMTEDEADKYSLNKFDGDTNEDGSLKNPYWMWKLKREQFLDLEGNAKPWQDIYYEQGYFHRVAVILVAVSLLWLTSLYSVKHVVENIIFQRPSMVGVGNAAIQLFDLTVTQKSGYDGCLDRTLDTCIRDYDDAHETELQAAEDRSQRNDALLELFNTSRIQAREEMDEITNFLARERILLDDFRTEKPDVECSKVEALAAEIAVGAKTEEAFDLYNNDTDSTLDALAERFGLADGHGKEYMDNATEFLGSRVVLLSSNFNRTVEGVAEGFASALGRYKQRMREVEAELDGEMKLIEERANQAGEAAQFVGGVMDFWLGMFSDLVATVARKSKRFIWRRISRKNPKKEEDEGSGLKEAIGNKVLNVLREKLRVDAISDILRQFEENSDENLQTVNLILLDSMGALSPEALGDNYSDPQNTLSYVPPEQDDSKRKELGRNRTENEEELDQVLTILVGQSVSSVDSDFEEPVPRSTNYTNGIPDADISRLPERLLDFVNYSDELLLDLIVNVNFVVDVVVYGDLIFRLVKTVTLIKKYWKMSSVGKPPIDIRLKKLRKLKAGHRPSKAAKKVALLTNPKLLSFISTILLLLLVTVFWQTYSPFYDAFKAGCVDTRFDEILDRKKSGTLLYRNVETLSFTYATNKGDNIRKSKLDDLNVRQVKNCELHGDRTNETFLNQLDLHQSFRATYGPMKELRDEMLTCLDLDRLTSETVFPDVFQTTLEDESVFVNMDELLEDSVYRCDIFEECDIEPCTEPRELEIKRLGFSASCRAEQWVHTTFLSSIFVFVSFMSLETFRKDFVKGIVRLWAERLNPYDYAFIATCTADGKHMSTDKKPAGFTRGEYNFFHEIRSYKGKLPKEYRDRCYCRLRRSKCQCFVPKERPNELSLKSVLEIQRQVMFFKFSTGASCSIIFAFLFQIPWIAAMVYVSRGIEIDEIVGFN